jgi:hypothetical protein
MPLRAVTTFFLTVRLSLRGAVASPESLRRDDLDFLPLYSAKGASNASFMEFAACGISYAG